MDNGNIENRTAQHTESQDYSVSYYATDTLQCAIA
jgi:CRISPR/Cas system-associated protein Csm6